MTNTASAPYPPDNLLDFIDRIFILYIILASLTSYLLPSANPFVSLVSHICISYILPSTLYISARWLVCSLVPPHIEPCSNTTMHSQDAALIRKDRRLPRHRHRHIKEVTDPDNENNNNNTSNECAVHPTLCKMRLGKSPSSLLPGIPSLPPSPPSSCSPNTPQLNSSPSLPSTSRKAPQTQPPNHASPSPPDSDDDSDTSDENIQAFHEWMARVNRAETGINDFDQRLSALQHNISHIHAHQTQPETEIVSSTPGSRACTWKEIYSGSTDRTAEAETPLEPYNDDNSIYSYNVDNNTYHANENEPDLDLVITDYPGVYQWREPRSLLDELREVNVDVEFDL